MHAGIPCSLGQYLKNTRLLVLDELILFLDKLILSLLAQMARLNFQETQKLLKEMKVQV